MAKRKIRAVGASPKEIKRFKFAVISRDRSSVLKRKSILRLSNKKELAEKVVKNRKNRNPSIVSTSRLNTISDAEAGRRIRKFIKRSK